MRMKKMLAVLAAISMLASMGISAAAEDEAVTTTVTTAEETVTTTATETTAATEATTATETTTDSETTTVETTVVTEENETALVEENEEVKMEDASDEISLNGESFTVKISVVTGTSKLVLSVLKNGSETNLNNICIDTEVSGELQVGNYYSIVGECLHIYAADGEHSYYWESSFDKFTPASLNNEVVDASTFQMNGKTVKVVLYGVEGVQNSVYADIELRLSVYVDGKLTNLAGIPVNSGYQGMQGPGPFTDEEMNQYSVYQYFSVSDNALTITPFGASPVSYTWNSASNQFVKVGETVTTTTTTTSTTTTTTTVTSDETVTEGMLYQIFEEYVAEKQAADPSHSVGDIDSFYYDAETQTAYGVYGRNGSMYYDRLCVITKDGVVEQDLGEMNYEEDAWDIEEAAYFTCNDSRFIVAVVDLYSNGGCLYAINVYNVSSGTPVKTNLYRILIGNVIKPHGYPVTDPNSSIELEDYFTAWTDDTITLNGVDYAYDTASQKFVEAGNSGKTDDGKTDSDSTSNKPSTNNTTGTPKTGDVATLPAVALGLTMTAAGIAAIIYKKRK